MSTRTLKPKQIYYPESDGKPMGETDWHNAAMRRIRELLEIYFEGQEVYVCGDMLLYYEEGNPKKFIVPDVFVVRGLKLMKRRTYQMWVEQLPPNVVVEVTSLKTKRNDAVKKPELYAKLGVLEYFLYDPDGGYLKPTLQGYRLIDGEYQRIEPEADGSLTCEQLGLRLWDDGQNLQLFRLDNGQRLLRGWEQVQLALDNLKAAKTDAANAKMDLVVARKSAAEAIHQADEATAAAVRKAEEEAALRQHAEAEAAKAFAEIERLKALLHQQGRAIE